MAGENYQVHTYILTSYVQTACKLARLLLNLKRYERGGGEEIEEVELTVAFREEEEEGKKTMVVSG